MIYTNHVEYYSEKKAEEIYDILVKANKVYREGNPFMEDYDFDLLESRLYKMDPNNKWFKRGVNDEKPETREYKLPYPMMSLDKVKRFDAVKEWIEKFPDATFVITPKFDGLSIGMSKDRAWTRGDGTTGQECTKHISLINEESKPSVSDNDIIRGEIIFKYSSWEDFTKIHKEAKSPRNSATGLINCDYNRARKWDYRHLSIMPYEIQGSVLSKTEQLEKIGGNYPKLYLKREEFSEKVLNDFFFSVSKDYPIDGVVIDVNEPEYRKGTEANGNPSYTIAYKHPSFSSMAESTISKVETNVNRKGVVTPIIHIHPSVILSGAEISKVNGINLSYVKDWKMYEGQKVMIVRSGEVIPKIVAVGGVEIPFRENFASNTEYLEEYNKQLAKRNEASVTAFNRDMGLFHCPSCGYPLKRVGVEYICTNNDKKRPCKGQIMQQIAKFFEICKIDGFGEAKLKVLYDNYYLIVGKCYENVLDFFDFTYENITSCYKYRDKELQGWGEKTVRKFVEELARIRNKGVCEARLFHALGYFDELGEKTIQKILDELDTKDLMNKEKLLGIEGIQEITANKFIEGYQKYLENKERIDSLFDLSYVKSTIISRIYENTLASEMVYIKPLDLPLYGKVVCATGFRDKDMFQKISEMGGIVSDSLTKAVNLLLVKDLSSTSSKVLKARKMGIEIMSKEEFEKKYGI